MIQPLDTQDAIVLDQGRSGGARDRRADQRLEFVDGAAVAAPDARVLRDIHEFEVVLLAHLPVGLLILRLWYPEHLDAVELAVGEASLLDRVARVRLRAAVEIDLLADRGVPVVERHDHRRVARSRTRDDVLERHVAEPGRQLVALAGGDDVTPRPSGGAALLAIHEDPPIVSVAGGR